MEVENLREFIEFHPFSKHDLLALLHASGSRVNGLTETDKKDPFRAPVEKFPSQTFETIQQMGACFL
jgi:hypothetical protein